jgi:hypothetical protein
MRRSTKLLAAALLFGASSARLAGAQPVAGQVDDFEDGTTQGWIVGGPGVIHPAPPLNTLGGPGGAGDHFLMLTALGGNGPGSRLAVGNATQWAGNYVAAGITDIGMSVNNFSQSDLFLRLVFEDPAGGPPSNVAFSTLAVLVPGGSGWTDVVFPVLPGSLTAGLGSVVAALSNTTVLRLYHSEAPNAPNPFFPIAPVTAQLGVDNVTALATPEPSSLALLAGGAAVVLARRRRAR